MFGALRDASLELFGIHEAEVTVPGDPEIYRTADRGLGDIVSLGTGNRRNSGVHLLGEPPRHDALEGDLLDSVHADGLERLAWYVSHHHGSKWGIYIREAGAITVGRHLAASNHSNPWLTGFDLLYLHELLHAAVDAAVTTIELVVRTPLYVPRLHDLTVQMPPWDPVEEGLANAHALRVLSRGAGSNDKHALSSFLAHGPEGYRDFALYRTPRKQRVGYAKVMAAYLPHVPQVPGSTAWLIEGALRETPDVPIYLVRDYPGPPVFGLIAQIPTVRDGRQFSKALKRLPSHVQAAWSKALRQLSDSTQHPGLRFKPVKGQPGCFSIRVGRDYRAILRFSDTGWEALRIEPRQSAY